MGNPLKELAAVEGMIFASLALIRPPNGGAVTAGRCLKFKMSLVAAMTGYPPLVPVSLSAAHWLGHRVWPFPWYLAFHASCRFPGSKAPR